MSNFFEEKTIQQWSALRLFSLYRLVVSIIFFGLSFFANQSNFLASLDPNLLRWVSGCYVAVAIIALISAYFRWLPYKLQVYLPIIIDIVAIVALMNLYGGITSGFGTLMIAVVAGGSLLLPGRTALLFAALATLAILGHEIYASLNGIFEKTAYTQAGLLGAALFATALLAITLAHRATESAKLAAQRGVDLANLAKLNEHLINRMEAGIMVVDDDGTIRMHNHAAWKLLNQPEINEQTKLLDISMPLFDLYKSWNKAAENPAFRNHLGKLKRANLADLQVRIVPVGLRKHDKGSVIYLNDNTEVDKQVQETKLASLGRLTASIAHEIRNPLGAISHAAQLLDESSELHKADKRLATIIQDQSVRLNNIINNVLRLSRREKPKPEKIELNTWLRNFLEEFTRTNDLQDDWVSLKITPPDGNVTMDANNLHQVLWNLCKNAKKYGASLGENVCIQLLANTNHPGTPPYLDVIDNGPGISAEHQSQLFEPFFTTSDTGTGLGLYLSRELCKNNGGDLRYINMPEGGSCFRIEFPSPINCGES
ncbi:MAG: PAS domain-containing protein [Gammaproteobacteria bacterium]|nr:PAS domain-containing protein [Gammaproteobacteria bacterium]